MGRSAKTPAQRRNIPGRFTTVELDGVGVATAPQRRSEEVEDRAVIEGENDHDLEGIAGELYMGNLDARIELAIAGPP
jgi:hypothetical protein